MILHPGPTTTSGYTYAYPRPAVTVDIVLFTFQDNALQALLIRRNTAPFSGAWALPGGFVDMDEDLEAAALRELREETNVSDVYLQQLYTFGAPDRDPRTRVITVAYFALLSQDQASRLQVRGASDAAEASWWNVSRLPELAFDHAHIVDYAVQRLRWKPGMDSARVSALAQRVHLVRAAGSVRDSAERTAGQAQFPSQAAGRRRRWKRQGKYARVVIVRPSCFGSAPRPWNWNRPGSGFLDSKVAQEGFSCNIAELYRPITASRHFSLPSCDLAAHTMDSQYLDVRSGVYIGSDAALLCGSRIRTEIAERGIPLSNIQRTPHSDGDIEFDELGVDRGAISGAFGIIP